MIYDGISSVISTERRRVRTLNLVGESFIPPTFDVLEQGPPEVLLDTGDTSTLSTYLINESSEMTFVIRNVGVVTLNITNAQISGTGYSITVAPASTVAPSAETTVTVQSTSSSAGVKTGVLTITTDAVENGGIFTINLSATVVALTFTVGSQVTNPATTNRHIIGTLTFAPEAVSNTWSMSYDLTYVNPSGSASPRMRAGTYQTSTVKYSSAQITLSAATPHVTGTLTGQIINSGSPRDVYSEFFLTGPANVNGGALPEWFAP